MSGSGRFCWDVFSFMNNTLHTVKLKNTILFQAQDPITLIIENLYLGDFRAAESLDILKLNGITHIVNCAAHVPEVFPNEFQYLSLHLDDDLNQDLSIAIEKSNNFIHSTTADSKIFIHCIQGRSRSAAILIAYLITYRNMTYDEAVDLLVSKRKEVRPNKFFVEQLCKLNSVKNNQKADLLVEK